MLIDDIELWWASKEGNAICSVTKSLETQYWFTEGHVHDEGASSQKLPFVSNETNNEWFGYDSFNETGNHNLLVNINSLLAIDRGA